MGRTLISLFLKFYGWHLFCQLSPPVLPSLVCFTHACMCFGSIFFSFESWLNFFFAPYLVAILTSIDMLCIFHQLCFWNKKEACSSITSTASYIGRACFSCWWTCCSVWKSFTCTWKTCVELALGCWLSSIWTILQFFRNQSYATWCCTSKAKF